ncbi:uncharacterized protein LOC123563558 [Mercenaria mercenaria]|uniref:uncharacterized protein LOC123563558 n=1 Tax=Mercenaria mercenaria TaxID=6596 RepID=UPI00234F4088|nr:uncharacterized protein LOC123563558 [Mercenaria mercenaria]
MYLLSDNIPCSFDGSFHYSWDYAQQVHIPHYSQEVGPVYFKTPRKCNVFGMCCEGSGKQVFYLVDESDSIGKGADSVVSMVHHYLYWYGHGEIDGKFHFDNAAGQNKNNIVLWYGLWRVLLGYHRSIEYSTMIAGHTKFEPDWHFGIWKNRWRRVNAETLHDIADTVDQSSKKGHNIAQLVNDGSKPVTFYQWRTFLSQYFKPLKNITKYHHFFISAEAPGIVNVKILSDSPVVSVSLLKMSPPREIIKYRYNDFVIELMNKVDCCILIPVVLRCFIFCAIYIIILVTLPEKVNCSMKEDMFNQLS